MSNYHKPVLLTESIDGLNISNNGIYVDVTFGGGGHSREILTKLGDNGRLLAFDRDSDSKINSIEDKRFTLIHCNYRYLKNYLKYYNSVPVDGILADLGISSHQIDSAERGFSTRFDGPLDFRMDKNKKISGMDILNKYNKEDLARILREYGDLNNAFSVASEIIISRSEKPLKTTTDLKHSLKRFYTPGNEQKFLAKVFQAIRIEVNEEIEALKDLLVQAYEILKPGGRLVIISYHSLEDRLVKNFMRYSNFENIENKDPLFGHIKSPFTLINKKPITPGDTEISQNKRARSAKLRIAEKNG